MNSIDNRVLDYIKISTTVIYEGLQRLNFSSDKYDVDIDVKINTDLKYLHTFITELKSDSKLSVSDQYSIVVNILLHKTGICSVFFDSSVDKETLKLIWYLFPDFQKVQAIDKEGVIQYTIFTCSLSKAMNYLDKQGKFKFIKCINY